jgi:hypothetical protein
MLKRPSHLGDRQQTQGGLVGLGTESNTAVSNLWIVFFYKTKKPCFGSVGVGRGAWAKAKKHDVLFDMGVVWHTDLILGHDVNVTSVAEYHEASLTCAWG